MLIPPIPDNEAARVKALEDYSILDSLPEQEYDDITQLASKICDTPISLIGLIDENRQWFKSKVGIEGDGTPRETTFCAHAILNPNEIMTVNDSRLDSRFQDNPSVIGEPHVVFYAGIPLVSPEGFPLGTLCVVDDKPKVLSKDQLQALKALSNQVVSLFELRKSKMLIEKAALALEVKNRELERFANVAAHDIKSPLSNISSLTEILISDYSDKLDGEAKTFLEMLNTSSRVLRNLVDGILEHSKTDTILYKAREKIKLKTLLQEIISLLDSKNEFEFVLEFEDVTITTNKTALQQILINLIANSIKYNDKKKVVITIGFDENPNFYEFSVDDNGSGIDSENLEKMFRIFEILVTEDRFGNRGNGIGLSTVKKLVEGLCGRISVDSKLKKGTRFNFTLAKNVLALGAVAKFGTEFFSARQDEVMEKTRSGNNKNSNCA